jgi:hypothetical protein
MEPPAVLAQNGTNFHAAEIARDCERQTLVMSVVGSDGADLRREYDHIRLAPRVRRFFETYLAADVLKRSDLRKSVAYTSRQFGFDPPEIPSLQDDLGAAVAMAQQAADIACANDLDQTNDGCVVNYALLADAYATLAMSYRYVAGVYATDPMLSDLGEAAVTLVLMAEREYDVAVSASSVPADSSTPTSYAFWRNQERSSTLSIFEPTKARRNEEVASSLDAISRRLKEEILLMA